MHHVKRFLSCLAVVFFLSSCAGATPCSTERTIVDSLRIANGVSGMIVDDSEDWTNAQRYIRLAIEIAEHLVEMCEEVAQSGVCPVQQVDNPNDESQE